MPLQLAQAIADHLAARVADSPIPTAVITREFLPRYDLADLGVCRVPVAPLRRSSVDASRGTANHSPTIGIGPIQRVKLTAGNVDAAAVETFVNFVLWIDQTLQAAGKLSDCTWTDAEANPLYDDEFLRSNSVLRANLTINYRALRRL